MKLRPIVLVAYCLSKETSIHIAAWESPFQIVDERMILHF